MNGNMKLQILSNSTLALFSKPHFSLSLYPRALYGGCFARAIDHFSITLSSPAEKTAIWLQSHVLMGCCEPGVVRACSPNMAARGDEFRARSSSMYTQLCAADTQGMCHPQLYNNAGGWCKFLAALPPQDSRHIWCGGARETEPEERCVKCQQRHRHPRARTWRCGNFKIGKFIYTHVRTLSLPHNSV